MARKQVALAKISRPRLHDVLARTRLYGALDQACARPVAWLCAQPGARVSAVEADAVGDAESGAVGGDGEAVSGVEVGVRRGRSGQRTREAGPAG